MRRRARIILAAAQVLGTLIEPDPMPPPPKEFDPSHHGLCNVNLFGDGKCDCEGEGEDAFGAPN